MESFDDQSYLQVHLWRSTVRKNDLSTIFVRYFLHVPSSVDSNNDNDNNILWKSVANL